MTVVSDVPDGQSNFGLVILYNGKDITHITIDGSVTECK